MKFSEKLMQLRKEKGMSQEDLAEQLDVTRQTVSKWELGISTPEMEKLVQMSKYFGVSVDELVSDNKINDNSKKVNNGYSSGEFVGIDEQYIPKNENTKNEGYVKEDKKAKNFMKVYLIFFIVFFILIFGFTIFGFVSTMFHVFKDNKNNIEQTLIEDDKDKIESIFENQVDKVENILNDTQNTINESREKHNTLKSDVEEQINETTNNINSNNTGILSEEEFNKEYEETKSQIEETRAKIEAERTR